MKLDRSYPPRTTLQGPANSPADRWYVRSAGTIRGPFRWETIATNLYLRRVAADDEVSADQRSWRALAELAALSNDERLRIRADIERGAEPAAAQPDAAPSGVRVSPAVAARRARSERVWAGLRGLPDGPRWPLFALATVLSATLLGALFISQRAPSPASDCDSAPRAGLNWDFCSKAGLIASGEDLSRLSARNVALTGARLERANLADADLSYAELTGADLSLSRLRGARLLGASLRKASLAHADLVGADLRFADFTDAQLMGAQLAEARLDHAIWTDGRVCEADSRGQCRAP